MYKENTLVEIKKGEQGKGLLIENDGFVSLDVKGNEKLNESLGDGESRARNLPNPFIVSAVFQKFGIENANGRIYPESILKREVEKYQQKIKTRSAYGECYTPDAECLTEEGWKPLGEIEVGDSVITLNTKTNEVELQKVTFVTDKLFDGMLYHMYGSYIDDFVTPEHGYPVYIIKNSLGSNSNDRKASFYGFKTATDIERNFGMGGSDTDDFYFIPCEKDMSLDKYSTDKRVYLNERHMKIEKVPYKGRVLCVETPNHTWYVKQGDKAHWTKNCNHPETSTIDLSRIAMNIIELHWEGHTLVGKMELPISDGFRNYGIISNCADQVAHWILSGLRIGVSSRALGSVTQVMDKLVVGDDLELVCWDCVSQPSTNSAFIEMNPQDLQPYIESDESNKDKPLIKEDKFSKFDSWLNG